MNEMPDSLLAADEPAPVTVHNENGSSPFLIVADHAGNSMPRALDRLGVLETECERHIAWDIGIGAVCRLVADALDATLIQQIYSRLVIDCNRPPDLGDVDSGKRRVHPGTGKHRLERKPESYARARDFPAIPRSDRRPSSTGGEKPGDWRR